MSSHCCIVLALLSLGRVRYTLNEHRKLFEHASDTFFYTIPVVR